MAFPGSGRLRAFVSPPHTVAKEPVFVAEEELLEPSNSLEKRCRSYGGPTVRISFPPPASPQLPKPSGRQTNSARSRAAELLCSSSMPLLITSTRSKGQGQHDQ